MLAMTNKPGDGSGADDERALPGRHPTSLEAAFRTHYTRLRDYVAGYVRSDEVASDIVQDLFVNLWERYDAGDLPLLTPAYLYTAARNRAIKYIRHRQVVARWEEHARHEPAPTSPRADDDLRTNELAAAIRSAIDQLPDRCREIFLMSREQELSYAAIAETLGISVKTVEVQMWRALKSLRNSLAPYLGIVVAFAEAGRWTEHLFQ